MQLDNFTVIYIRTALGLRDNEWTLCMNVGLYTMSVRVDSEMKDSCANVPIGLCVQPRAL